MDSRHSTITHRQQTFPPRHAILPKPTIFSLKKEAEAEVEEVAEVVVAAVAVAVAVVFSS
jgi:hypothetical protein